MDPNATLRELLDAILSQDEVRAEELAEALRGWLARDGFSPVPTEPPDYQGWKNYETWSVHLWLTGDQATDRLCLSLARQASAAAPTCGQVRTNIWTVKLARKLLLIEELKEVLDGRNPLRDEASVYSDLLGSAMYEVDWREIAEAFLERVTP